MLMKPDARDCLTQRENSEKSMDCMYLLRIRCILDQMRFESHSLWITCRIAEGTLFVTEAALLS
ncbi:hypothetical protein DQX05_09340 [Paenibacillus thiaminolyticus]|uniref:Uncharacterized protein n=1 Tax=Paenibacillus thiaminolyticus TaxID=49283 RepID=A0A3A3GIQ8_PANTH|nr:hypothetical protein DQX05_09340 [Paenibacillus thiaminolyticus]